MVVRSLCKGEVSGSSPDGGFQKIGAPVPEVNAFLERAFHELRIDASWYEGAETQTCAVQFLALKRVITKAIEYGTPENSNELEGLFTPPGDYSKPIDICGYLDGHEQFTDVTHPLASPFGLVPYCRHAASVKLGRWLFDHEFVGHIDGDSSNNDPANLEVLTPEEHGLAQKASGPTAMRSCAICGELTLHRKFCDQECAFEHRARSRKPLPWTKEQMLELLASKTYAKIGAEHGMKAASVRYLCVARFGLSAEELTELKLQRRRHRKERSSGAKQLRSKRS